MKKALKRWSDIHIALFEQRILLVVVGTLATALLISNQFTINDLQRQLRNKEYILAPGLTDFARVTPGIIAKEYVAEFAESLAAQLGNFTSKEVMDRYDSIEKYLASDFRIKFKEEITKELKLLASKDIAEMFVTSQSKVSESESGFQAAIFGNQFRYISGLKVFNGSHVFVFDLAPTAPRPGSPWALEVTGITRLSEEQYLQQQRSR